MITAHQIRRRLHYKGRNSDIIPFFRIFCDENIIDLKTETPDFLFAGGGFHQPDIWTYALVVVNICVITKPDWQFFFRRDFVNIADPASSRILETACGPMRRDFPEPLHA